MYIQINIRILNKLIKHWGLDKNNEMTVCPVISLFKGWTVITELFGVMDHEFFSGYFYHRVVTVRINDTYIYLPALFYLLHNNIVISKADAHKHHNVSQCHRKQSFCLDTSWTAAWPFSDTRCPSHTQSMCVYTIPHHTSTVLTQFLAFGVLFLVSDDEVISEWQLLSAEASQPGSRHGIDPRHVFNCTMTHFFPYLLHQRLLCPPILTPFLHRPKPTG